MVGGGGRAEAAAHLHKEDEQVGGGEDKKMVRTGMKENDFCNLTLTDVDGFSGARRDPRATRRDAPEAGGGTGPAQL